MSTVDIKDVGNEVYEALFALIGAYVVSAISKGLLKKSLGTPENIDGMVKLAIALGLGAGIVKYAQEKGLLPKEPFGAGTNASKLEGKEVANEVFEALFALVGAYIVSRASKGLTGRSLHAPESIEGMAKLAVALGIGASAMAYAQDKKWLPEKVFKADSTGGN